MSAMMGSNALIPWWEIGARYKVVEVQLAQSDFRLVKVRLKAHQRKNHFLAVLG